MAHLLEPGEVFSMMGRQAKGQQLKMFWPIDSAQQMM
jgi:hypothetical protein